jgi:hypothetical protein
MIRDELLTANRDRCRPPLAEAEVLRIARSAASYAAGPVRVSNRILNSRTISDQAKVLAMLIALTSDSLTNEEMADLWGVSLSKVKRARRELREADLLDAAREYPRRHYTRVPVAEVLLNDALSDGPKVVFATLARLDIDGDGKVRVGQEKLGERLGKERTQIHRDTKPLVAARLVRVGRATYAGGLGRRPNTNLYILLPLSSERGSRARVGASGRKGSSVQHRSVGREQPAVPEQRARRGGGSDMQRACSTISPVVTEAVVGRSVVGCNKPYTKLHGGAEAPSAVYAASEERVIPQSISSPSPAAKQPLQPTAAEGVQEVSDNLPSRTHNRATLGQVQVELLRRGIPRRHMPTDVDISATLAVTQGDLQAAVSLLLDDLRLKRLVPTLLQEGAHALPEDEPPAVIEPPPLVFTKQAVPPTGPVVSAARVVEIARQEGLDPEEAHWLIEAGRLEVTETQVAEEVAV